MKKNKIKNYVIKTIYNKIFWSKNLINDIHIKYILTIVNLGA
jgi:hypothetical protein